MRHEHQWFIDRIGKTIYRNKVKCDCESCKKGTEHGIVISDKTHADYLFDVQNELGIKYSDKLLRNVPSAAKFPTKSGRLYIGEETIASAIC